METLLPHRRIHLWLFEFRLQNIPRRPLRARAFRKAPGRAGGRRVRLTQTTQRATCVQVRVASEGVAEAVGALRLPPQCYPSLRAARTRPTAVPRYISVFSARTRCVFFQCVILSSRSFRPVREFEHRDCVCVIVRLIGGDSFARILGSSGYFSGLAPGGISLFKATGDKHARSSVGGLCVTRVTHRGG